MPDLIRFTMPDLESASPVRALHSLQERQVAAVEKLLAATRRGWSVDRHEGYDGDLTLMLSPPDDDAAMLVLHRTAAGFHLVGNHEDACRPLGRFDTLDEVLAALRGLIAGDRHAATVSATAAAARSSGA